MSYFTYFIKTQHFQQEKLQGYRMYQFIPVSVYFSRVYNDLHRLKLQSGYTRSHRLSCPVQEGWIYSFKRRPEF